MWQIAVTLAAGHISLSLLVYLVSYVFHHSVVHAGGVSKRRVRVRTPTSLNGTSDDRFESVYCIVGDLGMPFVFREIYEQRVYLKHFGDALARCHAEKQLSGDTFVVVDAGANIGLFARFMAQTFPSAMIYGAEPIEEVADVARRNTAEFVVAEGAAGSRVRISTVALGSSSTATTATLQYAPNLTCASASLHDLAQSTSSSSARSADLVAWVHAIVHDATVCGVLSPSHFFFAYAKLLTLPLVRWVVCLLSTPMFVLIFAWLRGQHVSAKQVSCRVVTLETMLREEGFFDEKATTIDLLKIDVEGAEMSILDGIGDSLWSRIEHVVVETQHIDSRVDVITRMLRSKGFRTVFTVDEEFLVHQLLGVTSVFASR